MKLITVASIFDAGIRFGSRFPPLTVIYQLGELRPAARLSNAWHKRDTRWKILVGAVFLARGNQDPAAAKRLDIMLDQALTKDRDLLKQWRSPRVT